MRRLKAASGRAEGAEATHKVGKLGFNPDGNWERLTLNWQMERRMTLKASKDEDASTWIQGQNGVTEMGRNGAGMVLG